MYLIKLNEKAKKMVMKSGVIAIFILPLVIIAILIANVYFRKAHTSGPEPEYKNQTVLPVDVHRNDGVRDDNPPATPQNDASASLPIPEMTEQSNQTRDGQKQSVAQLLIKFTTDESCKLKITNMDLDEVIDWDLYQNDNGTIYLKPGKYSIVATSVTDSSRSITYPFDVKPGDTHTTKNLHIRF